jgi:hypothetical protein
MMYQMIPEGLHYLKGSVQSHPEPRGKICVVKQGSPWLREQILLPLIHGFLVEHQIGLSVSLC